MVAMFMMNTLSYSVKPHLGLDAFPPRDNQCILYIQCIHCIQCIQRSCDLCDACVCHECFFFHVCACDSAFGLHDLPPRHC